MMDESGGVVSWDGRRGHEQPMAPLPRGAESGTEAAEHFCDGC